jgi:hypothetical protein
MTAALASGGEAPLRAIVRLFDADWPAARRVAGMTWAVLSEDLATWDFRILLPLSQPARELLHGLPRRAHAP